MNIVFIVLGVVLLAVLPLWPYSADWSYKASGGVGFLLAILVLLTLSGRSKSAAPKP